MRISQFNQVMPLLGEIEKRLQGSASLEQASNTLLDILVEQLGDSIVLTRFFATIPYGHLPAENREFVDRLVADRSIKHLINDETPILSLIASRGVKPNWNHRRKSAGHVGIPLASADFVDSIPMIARLLSEVGLDLHWLAADAAGIDVDTFAKISGVFYVRDAKSAMDQRSRKIISAQDFVLENQIQTVFGVGGGFAIGKTFLTLLFFCNEEISKARVAQFLPLISTIKVATVAAISKKDFFG